MERLGKVLNVAYSLSNFYPEQLNVLKEYMLSGYVCSLEMKTSTGPAPPVEQPQFSNSEKTQSTKSPLFNMNKYVVK